MVLNWLNKGLGKKSKSNHPLATSEGIEDVVYGLPTSNASRLVGEVGDWIAPEDKPDLDLPSRATAYLRLDQEAQAAVEELWFDVLAAPVSDPRAEQSWFALSSYTRKLMRGYQALLRDSKAAGEAGLDKKPIVLILVRAMRAAVMHKKLLRMRYRFVEPTVWTDIYWIYTYAETSGHVRTLVKAFPKSETESSVHLEFVIGMVFEIAPLGNIEPHQMESLDLVIRKFSSYFAFRDKRDAETLFYVDVSKNQWPDRLLQGLPHKNSMRYFGVGIALAQITDVLKEVLRTQEIPAWLVLPGEEKIDNCVVLLRKLIAHWSSEPPTRQDARARLEGNISVLNGFSQVRRLIAGVSYLKSGRTESYYSYEKMFDKNRHGVLDDSPIVPEAEKAKDPKELLKRIETAGDKELMQKWALNDSSDSGIGATAIETSPWLRIGAMVGYRHQDNLEWSIGVVRRLSRNAQNQALVGLRRFKGDPDVARAGSLDKREQSAWDSVPEAGIYGWQDAIVLQGTSTMLLEPNSYFDGRRFKLSIGKVKKLVKLTELIEYGADCELVRYSEYTLDEATLPPTETNAFGDVSGAPPT